MRVQLISNVLGGILMAVVSVTSASAQTKETLAVGAVGTNHALAADMERKGKTVEMGRVVEALDHQLISALVQSRKFSIVGRSDLPEVLGEQNLAASGVVDASTASAAGKVKSAKYKLVTTVDSFLEGNDTAVFNGRNVFKRRFQLSAQAVIYDTTTSEALEASNFQLEKTDIIYPTENEITDSKRSDDLMPAVAREMAGKVAQRTVEVIFPAKIIDKEDKLITINRGDAVGIHVGEIWNAYGPPKTITDPDSGQVIKRKGALLGRIRITAVEPTYSQGEVMEDKGVVVGCVLSKPQEAAVSTGTGN
jgi:curli biogenesis system outer membrane secretion channel CsgG